MPIPFPSSSTSLPRSHVLSYVASAESPTRVRQLSCQLLNIIAGIHFAIAAIALIALLCLVIIAVLRSASSATAADLARHLSVVSIRQGWPIQFFVFFYGSCDGITLWACAKPVRNGRKAACYACKFALFPTVFILVILAAVSAGPAIMLGFGSDFEKAHPAFLLFFLLSAFFILLILLVGDLIGFLTWIARNPITERPPVPFLPLTPKAS